MGTVIKRDGKTQAFSAAKVRRSVQRAARDVKLSAEKTRELIRDVADSVVNKYKNRRVKSTELRRVLLRRIDRRVKSVASAWRRFDRSRRKR